MRRIFQNVHSFARLPLVTHTRLAPSSPTLELIRLRRWGNNIFMFSSHSFCRHIAGRKSLPGDMTTTRIMNNKILNRTSYAIFNNDFLIIIAHRRHNEEQIPCRSGILGFPLFDGLTFVEQMTRDKRDRESKI